MVDIQSIRNVLNQLTILQVKVSSVFKSGDEEYKIVKQLSLQIIAALFFIFLFFFIPVRLSKTKLFIYDDCSCNTY